MIGKPKLRRIFWYWVLGIVIGSAAFMITGPATKITNLGTTVGYEPEIWKNWS